jgi:hypothetical protein
MNLRQYILELMITKEYWRILVCGIKTEASSLASSTACCGGISFDCRGDPLLEP